MKTKLYAALIEWYLSADKPLPRWLERACERDPRLAQARRASEELTRALTRSKPSRRSPGPSPYLEQRILAATRSEPERRRNSASAWGWGLTGAAVACLAVYSIFNAGSMSPPTEEPALASRENSAPLIVQADDSELAAPVSEIRIRDVALRNPLDREMESLTRDVKGALGFVASSFLPSEVYAELEAEFVQDEA